MHVQTFVTVVPVEDAEGERQFVVTNEATGRHFSANRTTADYLQSLRRQGDPARAALEAKIPAGEGVSLLGTLIKYGIVVDPGSTRADDAPPKGPVEGRLIAIRKDLFDIGPLTRKISVLGRLIYSRPAAIVWGLLLLVAALDLIRSSDRLVLALSGLRDLGLAGTIGFAAFFLLSKLVHELGHALAYRRMCHIEGLEPGPIRVGLMVFAATPFPYTDVSGAWRLKSRWRRALIGAGGVYAESWLMALIVVFWANTRAAPLSDLVLQVAVVSGGLAVLFNLNPAVKLDGYYILSDLFGRPNMAGRASSAARTYTARWLGADLPAPSRIDLLYWSVSYLYRWSIFLGIFWIAWQFDPRLGPVIAIVSAMMLLFRPIQATLRFAIEKKAKPLRLVGLGLGVVGATIAMFLPFQARMLAHGNYHRFETRFVSASEAGIVRLQETSGGLEIESDTLNWRLADARYRYEGLQMIARAVPASAAQQTRTESDLASMGKLIVETEQELARQVVSVPEAAVWTTLAADTSEGMTVTSDFEDPLAAISEETSPYLRIELDQSRLDAAADLAPGAILRARLSNDASCEVTATVSTGPGAARSEDGVVILRAIVDAPEPECATQITSGAAVVIRADLPPRSMIKRLRLLVSRLLQDRLPV